MSADRIWNWPRRWTLLIAFAALDFGVFANAILHEAGHLVGGLLTGYKFLSFRIMSLTSQKEDNNWHLRKFGIMGTLGVGSVLVKCLTSNKIFKI